jgi:hypothetical protein
MGLLIRILQILACFAIAGAREKCINSITTCSEFRISSFAVDCSLGPSSKNDKSFEIRKSHCLPRQRWHSIIFARNNAEYPQYVTVAIELSYKLSKLWEFLMDIVCPQNDRGLFIKNVLHLVLRGSTDDNEYGEWTQWQVREFVSRCHSLLLHKWNVWSELNRPGYRTHVLRGNSPYLQWNYWNGLNERRTELETSRQEWSGPYVTLPVIEGKAQDWESQRYSEEADAG